MNKASITHLPLMGRMAYLLICVETYLIHVYPDRDWRPLARVFWHFPKWFISDWMFFYSELTPDVALHNEEYDELSEYIKNDINEDDYNCLIQLYRGITDGIPDDPNDELCYVLNLPHELMYDYDAFLSDGNPEHNTRWPLDSSLGCLEAIENILFKYHIEMPDVHRLDFLAITDEKMLAEIKKIERLPSDIPDKDLPDSEKINYLAIKDDEFWGIRDKFLQGDWESVSIILGK